MSETKPCEFCGKPVTKKVGYESKRRKHWTCNRSCSTSLAHQIGNSPHSWRENPDRGKKETRPCAICGKEIRRYLTVENTDTAWTCSYVCSGVLQSREGGRKPRTGDTVNCIVCGKEFYRIHAYVLQDRRLCSRACNNAWQGRNRTAKNCLYCGKEFTVAPSQTRKYCSKPCETTSKIKRPVGRFHNGRPVLENYQGYLTVYEPTHPKAKSNGRMLEHRIVMEQKLGRYLDRYEQVNHIDHDRKNNHPDNLEVMDASAHSRETNAFTSNKRLTEAQELESARTELAEYRRRFGKLE